MNLIIFNMSNLADWEKGVVNRNFFICRELLKQDRFDRIVVVDFLAIQSIRKIFGKSRTINHTKAFLKGGFTRTSWSHGYKKIEAEHLFGVKKEIIHFSGLGYMKKASRSLRDLQRCLDEVGVSIEDSAVWNYNAFLPQAHEYNARLTVFDTVDNWSEHASYQKEAGLLLSNYEEIDKTADLIFTVSEGLLEMYTNPNTHWIPNGVDFALFEKSKILEQKEHFHSTRVAYIGTIQERVDFDLVNFLCERHPEKEFHFYGPVWSGVQKKVDELSRLYPNIYFHGRIPYRDIPKVLASVDVAIIPHRLDDFLSSTNPMKMYDYLAAGKPVVTTPGAGTEQFKDVLFIESENQAFSDALDKAIQEDSPQLIARRKEHVKIHTWKNRADQMMEEVEETLKSGKLKS